MELAELWDNYEKAMDEVKELKEENLALKRKIDAADDWTNLIIEFVEMIKSFKEDKNA